MIVIISQVDALKTKTVIKLLIHHSQKVRTLVRSDWKNLCCREGDICVYLCDDFASLANKDCPDFSLLDQFIIFFHTPAANPP